MGAIASFNYDAWIVRYPEFTQSGTYPGVSSQQAQLFWNEATLYFDNSGTGPVVDVTVQATLLNMLTAHIAMLAVGTAIQPASGLVGRIASANQGSVSVSVDNAGVPGTAAWFQMSQYGAAFWQATAPLRTMHYRPGPARLRSGFGRGCFPR